MMKRKHINIRKLEYLSTSAKEETLNRMKNLLKLAAYCGGVSK